MIYCTRTSRYCIRMTRTAAWTRQLRVKSNWSILHCLASRVRGSKILWYQVLFPSLDVCSLPNSVGLENILFNTSKYKYFMKTNAEHWPFRTRSNSSCVLFEWFIPIATSPLPVICFVFLLISSSSHIHFFKSLLPLFVMCSFVSSAFDISFAVWIGSHFIPARKFVIHASCSCHIQYTEY